MLRICQDTPHCSESSLRVPQSLALFPKSLTELIHTRPSPDQITLWALIAHISK
jgi:hypothetical protein